jgi:predicted ATPase with chaperone activity
MPPARDRDLPVRLVGRDRHVRHLEREALEPDHELPEEVAAPELRLVELRVDVVVVEDEFLAQELEETADEEEEVRRVARMDHVEAAREEDAPRQEERVEERGGVLDRVAQRALGLHREVVAVDRDAVDLLETALEPLARGADDRDRVARVAERARLLPHPPVERAGKVLDEDQDPLRDLHHQQIPS